MCQPKLVSCWLGPSWLAADFAVLRDFLEISGLSRQEKLPGGARGTPVAISASACGEGRLKQGTHILSLSGIIKCELIIQTAIDYKRMLAAAMGKVKRKLTFCIRDIKSLGK